MDKLRRKPERGRTDRADLYAILDDAHVGVLATVVGDEPWTVPLLYGRVNDRLVLHGSTGAGALRHVAKGAKASFCVHRLDGVVVADNLFNSSANYRSAVVRGTLNPLSRESAYEALKIMSDGIIPGRSGEVIPASDKELAATLTMALDIEDGQWLAKVRTGGPGESTEDPSAWTGVVPAYTVFGEPEPSEFVPAGTGTPASVRALAERGATMGA